MGYIGAQNESNLTANIIGGASIDSRPRSEDVFIDRPA